MVKNLPANAGDTRDEGSILKSGRSPGAGNGNHSSILAGIIPWTEESGGLQSRGGHKELGTTEHTHTHTHTVRIAVLFGGVTPRMKPEQWPLATGPGE